MLGLVGCLLCAGGLCRASPAGAWGSHIPLACWARAGGGGGEQWSGTCLVGVEPGRALAESDLEGDVE